MEYAHVVWIVGRPVTVVHGTKGVHVYTPRALTPWGRQLIDVLLEELANAFGRIVHVHEYSLV